MQNLNYNSPTVVRFELPVEWSAGDLTACAIELHGNDGVEVLASQDMTLYTATTLDSSATQYENEIVLVSGATALNVADAVEIAGAGGVEAVRVKAYNSTTRTATLEDRLYNDYDAGDAVRGLFVVTSIDSTDTAVFSAGKELTATYTPTGTGSPTSQRFVVSKCTLDGVNVRRRCERLYPRMYFAFVDPVERFSDMLEEAESQLRLELSARTPPLNYDRIKDQDLIIPTIMAKMACLWLLNGDIEKEDERAVIQEEYAKQFGYLVASPLWTDNNQDNIVDASEKDLSGHIFLREW